MKELKILEILKSKEKVDNIIIVETENDMPYLGTKEYSANEYIENIILYNDDNFMVVREHYHKHHYYRDQYMEDYDSSKIYIFITIDKRFKISHILDNYNKQYIKGED